MSDMFELDRVAGRQDAAFEAELAGFLDSGFSLGDAANFAGEADFAEENRFGSRTASRLLDAMAAMTPKSTAGSSTWTPPATFTKMS